MRRTPRSYASFQSALTEGDEIQSRSIQARKLGFGGIGNEDEASQIVRKNLDKLCGNRRILVFRRISGPSDNQPFIDAQDRFFLHDFFHRPFLSIACPTGRTPLIANQQPILRKRWPPSIDRCLCKHRFSTDKLDLPSQASIPPLQAPASFHTRRSLPPFQYIRRLQQPRQRDLGARSRQDAQPASEMQPAAGRTAGKRAAAGGGRAAGGKARSLRPCANLTNAPQETHRNLAFVLRPSDTNAP